MVPLLMFMSEKSIDLSSLLVEVVSIMVRLCVLCSD
jgi:hypothetical protein